MVLHNLWIISLSVDRQCIIKGGELWSIYLFYSLVFILWDLIDLYPFRNRNLFCLSVPVNPSRISCLSVCPCPYILMISGRTHQYFLQLTNYKIILYELYHVSWFHRTSSFLTLCLVKSISCSYLKKRKERRNISSVSTKSKAGGRCLEQGRFTYVISIPNISVHWVPGKPADYSSEVRL